MIAARWGTLDKLPPKGGAPTGERGADRLISAARTVCRSVDVKGHAGHVWGVPKATAEAEHERRATVHEPLPPGDQPISEDEVMAAMMEVFDDGNALDTDACLNNCQPAKCGDKVVQAGKEECDDGNQVDADACSNSCKLPTCSDKVKNAAETDVDCGGPTCDPCVIGKKCGGNDDCASGLCKAGVCSAVTLTLPNCAAANVTAMQAYTGAVMANCGCHINGSGGLTINNAATLKANTVNIDSSAMMKRVTPSNVDQSYLLYKILNQHLNVPGGGGGSMPQGGALTDPQKCLLINWVKSGAN
jgi:cysteine-rich repeat protein